MYVVLTYDGYDLATETQELAKQHVQDLRGDEIAAWVMYVSPEWIDLFEDAIHRDQFENPLPLHPTRARKILAQLIDEGSHA